ncbi:MAG: M20 family peptidase [Clostridiales bacterium]|nr:M20 family peptidase [Clostridiales bacterium]
MAVLWTILGLLALFIVITCIRAALIGEKPPAIEAMEPEHVDTKRAADHLSGAVQIPTVSHADAADTDWSQFEAFHAFLEESYPNIHRTLKREHVSTASLLYTWEGSDPSLDGVALLSHQDVVPISEGTWDDWQHPPFSGHNDGTYVWGRGALDMKNHLICVMEAVETLIEEGFRPVRTVYLCFGHNEEIVAAEDSGAEELMQTLKDRGVHLDSVIDEGGAIIPANVKGVLEGNLAGVGVAEKGYGDYRITIEAKGGHSSQPPKHTAVGRLAKAVTRIEKHQRPAKMLPLISDLFTIVGKRVTYPVRLVTCNLWLLKPLVMRAMKLIPAAGAMIHTTTAVTMAQGSPQANVLPQAASVTVNTRPLPGETLASTKAHLEKASQDTAVKVELLKGKEPSAVSPTDSRAFQAIEKLAVQMDNKNIVAPYLVFGGTDSYHYEPICENIYRFAPFLVPADLLLTTHATDERFPIAQFEPGITFFKRYIKTLCSD